MALGKGRNQKQFTVLCKKTQISPTLATALQVCSVWEDDNTVDKYSNKKSIHSYPARLQEQKKNEVCFRRHYQFHCKI